MKTWHVFLLLWIVCLASYIPSIGAGFVFDFPGWQDDYLKGKFSDIINCFGYPGNHQFLHFIFYSFYMLFDIQGVPWYLFFTTLHAVNGYLLYRAMLTLSGFWKFKLPHALAVTGALIFCLHPYVVEVVTWKVCVHYLISLISVFLLLIWFVQYLKEGSRKTLLLAALAYIAALFSLEISFVTPVVITMVAGMTLGIYHFRRDYFRKSVAFAGCLWLLLGAYLLLNKITLGSIVGHYGSDVHLQLDMLSMAGTELKYLVKHLAYARYFSFHTKAVLFDTVLSLPEVAFIFICVLIALVILYVLKFRSLHPKWHLVAMGCGASLMYALTVSNLFFLHLHVGMNDRFSYIPVAFLTIAVMALVLNFPSWLRYGIPGIMLCVNIYFQQKTLSYWHSSTKVLQSLKSTFRWHEAPYIFILNTPDNYKGIVMTAMIGGETGIDELLDFQTDRPYHGRMMDVFQFNMTSIHDGVVAEQTGPMQLKVNFKQWGNWWHREGIGASSYENEFYTAELTDLHYVVTFKQFPAGSVILYQDGMEWKEFEMSHE